MNAKRAVQHSSCDKGKGGPVDEHVDSLRMPFVPREDIPIVSELSGLATKPLPRHGLSCRAVAFANSDTAADFNTHTEDDARYQRMILQLLDGHSRQTCMRPSGVLDDACDMLEAATLRIGQVVVAAKD